MGLRNYVIAEMRCLRCGKDAEMEIETFFGLCEMKSYRIGDAFASWHPRRIVRNGGRPENGDLDGEGYVECPVCRLDFFVKVHVRADIVTAVSPDPDKRPYRSGEANGA